MSGDLRHDLIWEVLIPVSVFIFWLILGSCFKKIGNKAHKKDKTIERTEVNSSFNGLPDKEDDNPFEV